MLCVLPPTANLACDKSGCCRKYRVQYFTFWKKKLYLRFPSRKANLFYDVTPVFGVTPALFCPIGSQYPHAVHNLQKPDLLQDRFESWVVKCTTSLKFRSFRNNVGKQLARCCCPFTVARPSATSSHLVHCVISCGNRNLADFHLPLACLPRARPFSLSPTTSKRLLRRLHLRERTAGKFNRAVRNVSSTSWRPKSMFSGEECLIPDPGSSATILYFSKTRIEPLRAPESPLVPPERDGVESRGTQPSYIRGGSAPRPNPLTFCVPLLTGKVPLSCYTGSLFMHLVKTHNPF